LVVAQNVGFKPNMSLGDEIAGAYGIALFVRVFRRERGNNFFEARIATQRIPIR
jgi:hypothetical protein